MQSVQAGSGTQLATYSMGTGARSPGVKRLGLEVTLIST
jgi:hypothetical protein